MSCGKRDSALSGRYLEAVADCSIIGEWGSNEEAGDGNMVVADLPGLLSHHAERAASMRLVAQPLLEYTDSSDQAPDLEDGGMLTRYGVIGNDVIQVDPVHGRRVVITRRSYAQSISVGQLGRQWLVIYEHWHAMGEDQTDVWVRDGQTLEGVWWTRIDDDNEFGRDGKGCIVVGTVFPGKICWEAWRMGTWEKVEGYELPEGTRLLPGLGADTTPFSELPRLCDASPLGRWMFTEQYADKCWTGVVDARPGSVSIQENRKGRTFTRTIDGEFSLDSNRATWHGEHGGEFVRVTILALNESEAELSWDDGITHGWEITLTR